jgi:hypothetical protein
MASVQDLREYADRCLDWARAAKSDQEQAIFMRMATTWWHIARLTEEGHSLEDLVDIFQVPISTAESGRNGSQERDVA